MLVWRASTSFQIALFYSIRVSNAYHPGKALAGSPPTYASPLAGRGVCRSWRTPGRLLGSNVAALRPAASLKSGVSYSLLVSNGYGLREGSPEFSSLICFALCRWGPARWRPTLRWLLGWNVVVLRSSGSLQSALFCSILVSNLYRPKEGSRGFSDRLSPVVCWWGLCSLRGIPAVDSG